LETYTELKDLVDNPHYDSQRQEALRGDEEISTGYGTHWPERIQDLEHYLALAGKTGFNVVEQRESDRVFVLKPPRP
jgi:hypothetical protein